MLEEKMIYFSALATIGIILLSVYLLLANRKEKLLFFLNAANRFKNPIFISLLLFAASFVISTIFAVDRLRAFFGTLERAEGLVGFFFFLTFFLTTLLLFGKREWQIYWGITLLIGGILSIQTFSEVLRLGKTPGFIGPIATIGNPAFLAGYLLFAVFSALIFLGQLWPNLKKRTNPIKTWGPFMFCLIILVMSVVAIFLTETRSAILGLAIALIVAALYLMRMRPKPNKEGKTLLFKRAFVGLFLIFLLFTLFFFANKNKIAPIVERHLSTLYADFQSRRIMAKIAFNSVNPRNESFGKFLIGWGPENYYIAYSSHFDPEHFFREGAPPWPDRSHNKLLDALVMQGILGFVSYFAVWGFFFFLAFKKRGGADWADRLKRAPFVFLGTAYFIHTLFLFDALVTSIGLFAFFAFAVFTFSAEHGLAPASAEPVWAGNKTLLSFRFFPGVILLFTIIAVLFFDRAVLLPYIQLKKYAAIEAKHVDAAQFASALDEIFQPYTYAQGKIRTDLLKSVPEFSSQEEKTSTLKMKILEAAEDLIKREPYDARYFMETGRYIEKMGRNPKEAEPYYQKALTLAPNRPDIIYIIGRNLLGQGRTEEGKKTLQNMTDMLSSIPSDAFVPEIFVYAAVLLADAEPENITGSFNKMESIMNRPNVLWAPQIAQTLAGVYRDYMLTFYIRRDTENFLRAISRMEEIQENWEKILQAQFEAGQIKKLPPKKSGELKRAIEAFKERGWEAEEIRLLSL